MNGSLTLNGQDASLEVNDLSVTGSLNLLNGAILQSHSSTSSDYYGLSINASIITIDGTSRIDVNGKGSPRGYRWSDQGPRSLTATEDNSAGSYGGYGDSGNSDIQEVYGDFLNPNEFGSGGTGSAGGGLIRLVAETLTLDGIISANGEDRNEHYSGSGGGIYIDVDTFNFTTSSGSISANGGFTSGHSYAGGGGRVAIYYGSGNFDFSSVFADGGIGNGTTDGQPGTVHISDQGSLTYITGHHPTGSVNQLQTFGVTFGNEIDELSFTPADISMTGPNGAVPVTNISRLRGTTFVFDAGTLQEGEYTIIIGPDIESRGGQTMDTNADGISDSNDTYTFTFNLDNTTPAKPVVTSHSTTELNTQNLLTVTLEGTREDDVRIFINGEEKLAAGTLDWSLDHTLVEGLNTLTLTAVDAAGNVSPDVVVQIDADSVAPVLATIAPLNNAHVPAISELTLEVTETGSGLDAETSTLTLFAIAPLPFHSMSQLSTTP